MGARGPVPSPSRSRERDNKHRYVSARETAPELPDWCSLTPNAELWWNWAWKQPVSGVWRDEDIPAVARRAQLEATVQEKGGESPSSVLNAIAALDNALGLNPVARERMHLKLEDAEKPETSGKPANVIKLVP